jgi:multidrug efflux pump subunit AcrA (membrane-fusion protein)
VLVDGQFQERIVRTGASKDEQTEILSGLSEGEKVLVKAS